LPKFFVFLCEGDHDQNLIQLIAEKNSITRKNCNHEKIIKEKIRGGEITIIRDNYKKHSLKQTTKKLALIKNEKNKDICLEIFVELLKNGDTEYILMAVFDQDSKTLKKIREAIKKELKKEIIPISENCYKIRHNQYFFLIPKSLEIQVEDRTRKKIDNKRGKKKQMKCLLELMIENPSWIPEIERIVS
jgi:hypothetical protein